MSVLIIVVCGLVIGLSVALFAEGIGRMSAGRCCEGCGACPQKQACSSRAGAAEPDEGKRGGT